MTQCETGPAGPLGENFQTILSIFIEKMLIFGSDMDPKGSQKIAKKWQKMNRNMNAFQNPSKGGKSRLQGEPREPKWT